MLPLELDLMIVRQADFLMLHAFKFTHHKETAEDLVQDTLYRALANKKRYSTSISIRAWLYTIMRNIFINCYHKTQTRRKFLRSQYHCWGGCNWMDPLAVSYAGDIQTKQIWETIHALPLIFKQCLILQIEGFKYAEIATIVKEPVTTVKSRIHFARQTLRLSIDKL